MLCRGGITRRDKRVVSVLAPVPVLQICGNLAMELFLNERKFIFYIPLSYQIAIRCSPCHWHVDAIATVHDSVMNVHYSLNTFAGMHSSRQATQRQIKLQALTTTPLQTNWSSGWAEGWLRGQNQTCQYPSLK